MVYLANEIHSLFSDRLKHLVLIIDREFDSINENIIDNPYLHYTDFANLEMYLFNVSSIEKFLKLGLKNFPFTAEQIIEKIEPILLDLFSIRYARHVIDKNCQLPQLDKLFKIKNGNFSYDFNNLLDKFLSKNRKTKSKSDFEQQIAIVKNKYEKRNESRFFMHGKDFFELFFLLIKKVKNPYNFNSKSFVRSFFVSIEIGLLNEYILFSNLVKVYK